MTRHALYLVLRYLQSAPGRSAVLVAGLAVALFLPAFLWTATARLEQGLLARAEASPVLVGRKGNEFDLTMSSLYFRGRVREPVAFRQVQRLSRYGLAVPLYVAHSVSGAPLVGTSPEYFDARGLSVAEGRRPALLGEVVAGAAAAHAFHLSVGDSVRSDLANLYNLSGAYPVLLEVVGVLAPAGSADDDAFFADVKTLWVVDGALHGHDAVTGENADRAKDGENLEATAALFMFQELDEVTRASFHLHGDGEELPISSVLVFPSDRRQHDQLLGELALDPALQAVRPVAVVRTVLGIVLRVRDGGTAALALVATSTGAFVGLVLLLSLRLRRDELALYRRMGASRRTVAALVGVEVLVLGLSASLVAGVATWAGLGWLALQLGG